MNSERQMTSVMFGKHCNSLQSEDKKRRKKALEELSKELCDIKSDALLQSTTKDVYKHILRCFSDKVESCRELSIIIISDMVKLLPENEDEYLAYIMPVLLQRIGGQEIVEPSEEVRMSMVLLVHLLIDKFPTKLPHYLDDLIQILARTLVDPYPKIKKESCDCVSELAQTIPRYFYNQSESLIKPILVNFTHQHSRVRISAINAMGNVIRYGNNKSLGDVVVPMAERLFDQAPAVRQAVSRVIGMWLIHLPDRYSYFPRLLPLILTSLNDNIPELRQEVWALWEAAGKQYMEENENDLKDEMDFMIKDPQHYPTGVTRPNLGCRTLVCRHLAHIVTPLVSELSDWLPDIRFKASQLMCEVIVCVEQHITHHLERLLPGLYRASADEDPRVVHNAERASELLGYFVTPDIYCRLLLPTLEDTCSAAHLRVLGGILRGGERGSLSGKLPELASFLSRPEMCQSKDVSTQLQLLSCCSAFLTVSREDCSKVSEQLFRILITTLGLAADDCIVTKAKDLLQQLSALCGHTSVSGLYEMHMGTLLQELQDSAESWSLCTPERFIFEALLVFSGRELGLYLHTVGPILATVCEPSKDPEMRLKLLTLLAAMLMDETRALAQMDESGLFIAILVQDVIIPNLVWRAGRTAEALRTASVSCLCTALHHPPACLCTPNTIQAVFDKLLPLLLATVEDSSQRTRLFSLRALCHLLTLVTSHGVFTSELLYKIYPVLMKRLDDVSDDVRLSTVKTLVTLFKILPSDFSAENSEVHLEALFNTMLIHLDDPEPSFQRVMLDALKNIGCVNPVLLSRKVDSTKQNFRNIDGCKELLSYLQTVSGC